MATAKGSKFGVMVGELGQQIADGELASGAVLNLALLEEKFEVSRTVAREAMRCLESLGMITARRRVGLIVSDDSQWDALNLKVIEWRLNGPQRDEVLRSLMDLRLAVEPTAARLCARNATAEQKEQLLLLATQIKDTAGDDNYAVHLEADIAFHTGLLDASGNFLFTALEPAMIAFLEGRRHLGLVQVPPNEMSIQQHVDLAMAIKDGNEQLAEHYSRELLGSVSVELA